MKVSLFCLCFAALSAVCTFPLAWVAARMRTSFYLGGYFSTDPVLFQRLWLLLSLLVTVVGCTLIVPGSVFGKAAH